MVKLLDWRINLSLSSPSFARKSGGKENTAETFFKLKK
jgi:hypothetical protein